MLRLFWCVQLLLCQERRPIQVGFELGSSNGDFYSNECEGLGRLVYLQEHTQGQVSGVLKMASVADTIDTKLSCRVWDKLTTLYCIELRFGTFRQG